MDGYIWLAIICFAMALTTCHGSYIEDAACIETYGVECRKVTPKMEGLFRKQHNLIGE